MSHRLHSLRMENDAAGFAMREAAPRFARMAGRHENGTAPRAISVYQLFQTPTDLARRMAELLNPKPEARILEPSAGLGRLLDALAPFSPSEIVAVELAADCAGELFRQERQRVTIKQRDFLTLTTADLGTFDAVIMNPPFHMRADIQHIEHASRFLSPGGKLVAICLDGHKRAETLQPFADSWEVLPTGTFREAGTNIGAVLLTISEKQTGAQLSVSKTRKKRDMKQKTTPEPHQENCEEHHCNGELSNREAFKCATFDQSEITPEIRALMNEGRRKAEESQTGVYDASKQTILKNGYCWCEMCGYNAKLPAQYRKEVEADHACPWCHNTTGALLVVEDKLAAHVIPDQPMMTWPQTELPDPVCISCKHCPVTWPLVCDHCQDKEAQAELRARLLSEGEEPSEWECKSCGMIYDGGIRCTYCGDSDPIGSKQEINHQREHIKGDENTNKTK